MRPTETRQVFEAELTYPTTRRAAIEQVGGYELEAPTGEATLLATALRECPEREFDSATGLYAELMSFLDSAFVGRVGYDDRGGLHQNWTAMSL
ncbi:DUF5789 family protein [Halosegnis longus]|uniref:DUF5789 family protein n=1 Tax=Halosegnis longus TaxID=2216012 RepID=UPI00156215DD|nr:hypothetical protein [Halosegnis longus]